MANHPLVPFWRNAIRLIKNHPLVAPPPRRLHELLAQRKGDHHVIPPVRHKQGGVPQRPPNLCSISIMVPANGRHRGEALRVRSAKRPSPPRPC